MEPEAAHAVKMLLPEYANGDLSVLCVWPDQIRHWFKYRWTSPLHFIDTPDQACTFDHQSKLTSINSSIPTHAYINNDWFLDTYAGSRHLDI